MITLTINGKQYTAEEGQNLLQAALDNGIEIPHLCYHEKLSPYGGCRLCLVEITKGKKTTMTTSCTYPAAEGIQVQTDTPQVRKARRLVMELILPMAPNSPRIQALAGELGVERSRFTFEGDGCIKCGLCIRACEELVGAGTITFSGKGPERKVKPPFDEEPVHCLGCAACVYICPTGCIQMDDLGRKRRIDRWKKTLKMKKCKECSRPYIPVEQIEYFLQRTADSDLTAEWFEVCPDCRQ